MIFYDEHLQILKEIRKNYLEILNKNRYVDGIKFKLTCIK